MIFLILIFLSFDSVWSSDTCECPFTYQCSGDVRAICDCQGSSSGQIHYINPDSHAVALVPPCGDCRQVHGQCSNWRQTLDVNRHLIDGGRIQYTVTCTGRQWKYTLIRFPKADFCDIQAELTIYCPAIISRTSGTYEHVFKRCNPPAFIPNVPEECYTTAKPQEDCSYKFLITCWNKFFKSNDYMKVIRDIFRTRGCSESKSQMYMSLTCPQEPPPPNTPPQPPVTPETPPFTPTPPPFPTPPPETNPNFASWPVCVSTGFSLERIFPEIRSNCRIERRKIQMIGFHCSEVYEVYCEGANIVRVSTNELVKLNQKEHGHPCSINLVHFEVRCNFGDSFLEGPRECVYDIPQFYLPANCRRTVFLEALRSEGCAHTYQIECFGRGISEGAFASIITRAWPDEMQCIEESKKLRIEVFCQSLAEITPKVPPRGPFWK